MKKAASCLALLTFVTAQALSQDPSTSRVLSTVEGSGQAFPSKPIRILASGVGGNGDFMARLVAQETAPAFGQPVIVDNRSAALSIEKFLDSGVEVIGSTPGELGAAMQSEIRRMGEVIRAAGIQE